MQLLYTSLRKCRQFHNSPLGPLESLLGFGEIFVQFGEALRRISEFPVGHAQPRLTLLNALYFRRHQASEKLFHCIRFLRQPLQFVLREEDSGPPLVVRCRWILSRAVEIDCGRTTEESLPATSFDLLLDSIVLWQRSIDVHTQTV